MLMFRGHDRVRGVGLVELMIGVAIGLAVLLGLATMYLNTLSGGRTTTSANQLSQEVRALMDIMVNDIRRAGHWGAATVGVVNPFTGNLTRPRITSLGADRACILYSYDAAAFNGGAVGAVDAGADFFGFQLTADGVVQAVRSATLADTATACGTLDWENLTDALAIQVSRLTFTTTGSKCIAFNPNTYVATDPATFTQWTTTSGNGPACDPAAPGAPAPYPGPTNSFVETRQVNIELEGRSLTDPTLPPLTLRESVAIRANRTISP